MVIRHILHYLTVHPDAKDTVQGILRWWLPKDEGAWSKEEVQEALDILVARGWVTQRRTIPSRTLYGLNKKQLEEIKAFFREHASEADGPRECSAK